MFNCLYQGKPICSLDAINNHDIQDFSLIREWKLAGDNDQLLCEECGSSVILKAGSVRIPHFAHKANNYCLATAEFAKESLPHKLGKTQLYHYLKNLYPDSTVRVNYRLSNGRRADIYVEFQDKKNLAIEFQRHAVRTSEWDAKNNDYIKLGIPVLWMLSKDNKRLEKASREIDIRFFDRLILNEVNGNTAIYLDVQNQRVTLAKKILFVNPQDNQPKYETLFKKEYPLKEITILPTGQIESSFFSEFILEEKEFMDRCKEKEATLLPNVQAHLSLFKEKETLHHGKPTYLSNFISNYQVIISNAIDDNEESQDKIIEMMKQDMSVCNRICDIFEKKVRHGDSKAREIYANLVKRSGLKISTFI